MHKEAQLCRVVQTIILREHGSLFWEGTESGGTLGPHVLPPPRHSPPGIHIAAARASQSRLEERPHTKAFSNQEETQSPLLIFHWTHV